MDDPDDDVAPIAALFDEHCGFVLRSLRHLGVDEPALDDAAQDVFITAHRRWETFERRSSPRTWLFGIARRVAFRYRRSARTRSRRFVAVDVAREAAEHPVDRIHAAQALATLIGRLDGDKRAVFVLSEIEGMTAPEVSEALGIPLGTAYSRLRAAWQTLGRVAGKEQLRELGRMRSEPDEAARRRMWSAIAIGIGPGRAAAIGIASQLKWLVTGAALGAGLLGVGAVALPSTDARVEIAAATPSVEAAPETPREIVDADPPVASAPIAEAEVVAPPPAPREQTTSAPRVRTPRTVPEATPLAEELRLVRGAQTAVRERRPDDALALLDEHAQRFPEGQLAAERRSTRVSALCLAGRTADAASEARALGRARAPCADAE